MFNILPSGIKIILWGSVKDDGAKQTPMILRVMLAIALTVVWLVPTALLFWVGTADHKAMLVILEILCLLSVPVTVVLEIKMKKDS